MPAFESSTFFGSAAVEERLSAPAAAARTGPGSGVMDVGDVAALLRELRVVSQLGDRDQGRA